MPQKHCYKVLDFQKENAWRKKQQTVKFGFYYVFKEEAINKASMQTATLW